MKFGNSELYMTRKEQVQSEPPAYKGSPYYSQEFVKDFIRKSIPPLEWDKNTNSILLGDLVGRFYNVQHGHRVTVGASGSETLRILLLGGSTIYNQEVPDEFTVASLLQRCINTKYPKKYKVVNGGLVAVSTESHWTTLQKFSLKPGDHVIYYSGLNDLFYTVYEPRESDRLFLRGQEPKGIFKFALKMKDQLYLFRGIVEMMTQLVPPHLQDSKRVSELLTKFEDNYFNRIQTAWAYSIKNKANFHHFLQGSLFHKTSPTSYEQNLLKNSLLTPYGLNEIVVSGLERIDQRAKQSDWMGAHHNLTKVFDQPQTGEIFFDYVHVNEKGNQMIANAICSRL